MIWRRVCLKWLPTPQSDVVVWVSLRLAISAAGEEYDQCFVDDSAHPIIWDATFDEAASIQLRFYKLAMTPLKFLPYRTLHLYNQHGGGDISLYVHKEP